MLREGGRVYTITDVEELGGWIAGCFDGRAQRAKDVVGEALAVEAEVDGDGEGDDGEGVEDLFERVSEDELASDPCVRIMSEETEEGKKVTRNNGRKFIGVWRRRKDPAWP